MPLVSCPGETAPLLMLPWAADRMTVSIGFASRDDSGAQFWNRPQGRAQNSDPGSGEVAFGTSEKRGPGGMPSKIVFVSNFATSHSIARGRAWRPRPLRTRGFGGRHRAHPFPRRQSTRRRTRGLTESARCAGIHVATSPRSAMATTTPVSTRGSCALA